MNIPASYQAIQAAPAIMAAMIAFTLIALAVWLKYSVKAIRGAELDRATAEGIIDFAFCCCMTVLLGIAIILAGGAATAMVADIGGIL